jgi:D-alanyl-D-alanine dipeptidase
MLIKAQNSLPEGLKFCVFEGYRNPKLQKNLFDKKYCQIKTQNPHWPHRQLFEETTKFVSPITNLDGSQNIPPHCTGAAVDVFLIDANGVAVDMGIRPGEPFTDAEIISTNSSKISPTAQQNRKIMAEVLKEVGFVNYPTEYWHWSYGDRYWAYHVEATEAIYGLVSD